MSQAVETLKARLGQMKNELEAQKKAAASVEALVGHSIEREAGIWEMDYDDLEGEMWSRFKNLEFNAECMEKKDPPGHKRRKDRLMEFVRTAWRNIKNPLARLYMQKYWRFNLDRQNQINRDSVPYCLAQVLTLQKIKDRLNRMEEQIKKIQIEQQAVYEEFLEIRSRESNQEKTNEKIG